MILLLAAAIGGGALAGRTALPVTSSAAAPHSSARTSQTPSYGWPIKPFDKQHPVRGSFGDPRTVFTDPPTRRGLMNGGGEFLYHFGIDISAPDGTAVYPVRSGVVRTITPSWVGVDSGDGVGFEYWHIKAAVRVGDHVTAERDVLGYILQASKHVHLSELLNGTPVNPLAPGHLGPYSDGTTPRVEAITFRSSDTGPELLPEYLHGRVELVAAASDTQAVPVPGQWAGLPITPAKITYRIAAFPTLRTVVPETVALDVTNHLPAANMWHTYARGTHMNMVKMGVHRYWYNPGVYLFKLTPTLWDTRQLPDGVYRITVTAWDSTGNHSSANQIFQVHNRASWLKN